MPATDQQDQNYCDQYVRTLSEKTRDLELAIGVAISLIDDVYASLTAQTVTWTDSRTDGPPHLATPADVLAWNTFMRNIQTAITSDPQWPVIQKLCVRQPS